MSGYPIYIQPRYVTIRPRATPEQIVRMRMIYDTLHIPVPVNLRNVSERIAACIIKHMSKWIADTSECMSVWQSNDCATVQHDQCPVPIVMLCECTCHGGEQ